MFAFSFETAFSPAFNSFNKISFFFSFQAETQVGQHQRQITPISSLRPNVIIQPAAVHDIPEEEEEVESEDQTRPLSHIEFSLDSIERSLQIYAHKQHQKQLNEQLIRDSLDAESSAHESSTPRRLIGDRSRHHLLPCTHSLKHSDLNVIEPATLTRVLDGAYDAQIARLIVVDSRYPYEYEGGHIRDARNLYTREKLYEEFLGANAASSRQLVGAENNNKRTIVVFHCEFSSERGPNLLRFLRNQDRDANRDAYPRLFYPELYLLEGGYKAFYETHAGYCEPTAYKPMLHADHVQDLKHFRAKTKTWETQHRHHHHHQQVTSTGVKGRLKATTATSRHLPLSRLQRFPKSTLF